MTVTFLHTPTLWLHSNVVNLSLNDRHQRCFQSFTITKCNVYEFSVFCYYKKKSWIWIFKNEYHSAHKISHIWGYIRMMNSWRWNCWVKRICAFKILWDILKLLTFTSPSSLHAFICLFTKHGLPTTWDFFLMQEEFYAHISLNFQFWGNTWSMELKLSTAQLKVWPKDDTKCRWCK